MIDTLRFKHGGSTYLAVLFQAGVLFPFTEDFQSRKCTYYTLSR